MPVPWPESAEIKLYTGGCHCKKVRFEFEHPDIYTMPVMSCNCSICEERGYLTVGCLQLYTSTSKFKITRGVGNLISYHFGSEKAQHCFCSTCGRSVGPDATAFFGCIVVNTRTIDGIDIGKSTLQTVDGKSRPLGKPDGGAKA
ncbi:Mss4-like protein [Mycena rebaudengoi]|nr:Mss4-like protein [Mycena rebaudengoi]